MGQCATQLLPCLTHPFVLIVGDHNVTTPLQIDRWFESSILRYKDWLAWLNNTTQISHLFVEHLDQATDPKHVTPIPLGFNPREYGGSLARVLDHVVHPPSVIQSRPLCALFTNRVRGGKQFAVHATVRAICEKLDNCDVKEPKKWTPFRDSKVSISVVRPWRRH